MQINLNIGNSKTLDSPPINTFRINCESMHGDADHFTIDYKDILDHDTAVKIIKLLCTQWGMDEDDKHDDDKVRAEIELHGKQLGFDYPLDLYMDIIPFEVTCEDFLATPESIEIVYFDHLGIEHEVGIEVNGMEVSSITSRNFKGLVK